MKIGLLINPWSGIGGQVALKGSDGKEIVQQALRLGATQTALKKAQQCFDLITHSKDSSKIQWICSTGDMGSNLLDANNIQYTLIDYQPCKPSTSDDSKNIAKLLLEQKIDVLLFAGGDGTARDIYEVIGKQVPVIGIPAGVKIHSGVYAITPQDAARCLLELLKTPIIEISEQEVRDINEAAFRENKVQSKYFGDMHTPKKPEYIQAVKMGGVESDELLNDDIADYIIENLQEDILYFVGSGKTLDCLMQKLNLDNTLLGVDAILNNELIQKDLTANDILTLMQHNQTKILLSVIGGQGHIFGRGNHQFNQQILEKIKIDDLIVVANKRKLMDLEGKALIIDSFDESLKLKLNNRINLITGYNQHVTYPVR